MEESPLDKDALLTCRKAKEPSDPDCSTAIARNFVGDSRIKRKRIRKSELDKEERRHNAWILSSQGYSQMQIASMQKVSQPTVHRDLCYEKDDFCSTREKYAQLVIEQKLKELNVIEAGSKELWQIANNEKIDPRQRIAALQLLLKYNNSRSEIATGKGVRWINVRTKAWEAQESNRIEI